MTVNTDDSPTLRLGTESRKNSEQDHPKLVGMSEKHCHQITSSLERLGKFCHIPWKESKCRCCRYQIAPRTLGEDCQHGWFHSREASDNWTRQCPWPGSVAIDSDDHTNAFALGPEVHGLVPGPSADRGGDCIGPRRHSLFGLSIDEWEWSERRNDQEIPWSATFDNCYDVTSNRDCQGT